MRNTPTPWVPKPLLSVEEAAMFLGETRSTLYRAIKDGNVPIPVHRIGSRIRIPRRSLERFLAGEVPDSR
jgi:excisionase family DNA binding protein